jgi:D-glycero-D-manno-heptose 1,7-bisphosphate phosphatase
MEHRLIMFDADGTLRYCTVAGQPCPNASEEWKLFPGTKEKLAHYAWGAPGIPGTGYGIASNQGGVGVGYFSLETARTLLEDTFLAAFGFPATEGTIELCPHAPRSGCACRKPLPLMLQNIIERYGIHPREALFVGDMENDRLAAENACCDFTWAWEFFGRMPDRQEPR